MKIKKNASKKIKIYLYSTSNMRLIIGLLNSLKIDK